MKLIPTARMATPVLILVVALAAQASNTLPALISLAKPNITSVSASADSTCPVVSADGRLVVFTSLAGNLVTNEFTGGTLNVYVRDRSANKTVLVSVNQSGVAGLDGPSNYPTLSSNGQLVAFQSSATKLVPGDTNNFSDIFVRDLITGTNVMASINSGGGGGGNGDSSNPAITASGRFVFFESVASDLVLNDSNQVSDVFMRDLQLGTTTLISVNSNSLGSGTAASSTPVANADGKVVAFRSSATNLAPITNGNKNNLFVRNLETGVTTMLDIIPPGLSNRTVTAFNCCLSVDGRYLAFKASISGTSGPPAGIYWCDLDQGTNVLVAPNLGTTNRSGGGDDLSGPVMSLDGLKLAFEGVTSNTAIYCWSALSNVLELVSISTNGGATLGFAPVISADGRHVAFMSNATNLVASVANGEFQLYSRDLTAGVTRLVSGRSDGTAGAGHDFPAPSFSADGSVLAFQSRDNALVTNDNNQADDVFARDLTQDTTQLISVRDSMLVSLTAAGMSSIEPGAISADGRFVAFVSTANDLAANDTNDLQDVFVYDLVAGQNVLASVNQEGNAPGNGYWYSGSPALSANGRFIAFVSTATNLVLNDTNGVADVFWRDLWLGTTKAVSLSTNGAVTGNNESINPSISADGRYIAFESLANNLATNDSNGGRDVFLHDTVAGTTRLLGVSSFFGFSAFSYLPVISGNGQSVAFLAGTGGSLSLFLYKTTPATVSRVTSSGEASNPSLSFNGRHLVFQTTANNLVTNDTNARYDIIWRDNQTGSNALVSVNQTGNTSGNTNSISPVISADGRFVVFVSASSNLVANDLNGTNDVFLRDLVARTTTLVSVKYSGTNGGNGSSDSPTISAGGRYVVFRSFASDLVSGDTNTLPDVFIRDLQTGVTTLLSLRENGSGAGNNRSSQPLISADGRVIVFRSFASDLVGNDFNQLQDVLYVRTAPSVLVDTDGDGLADAWEMANFGDLSRDGSGDFDGDGMSDSDEFKAGTNPLNSLSVFRGQIVSASGFAQLTVIWPVELDKTYHVQYKNELSDTAWLDLVGTITVSAGYGSIVDSSSAATPRRFYRIATGP